MNTMETCFTHAFSAWEKWNLMSLDEKSEYLLTIEGLLKGSFQEAFQYQMVCSKQIVGHIHHLTGPTGETNELYIAGRGVGVLIIDTPHKNTALAVNAMLAALLTSGNSVIVCSDNTDVIKPLVKAIEQSNLPTNLVQFVSLTDSESLLDKDIRNVAFVGSEQDTPNLNRKLALRSGAITALVSETDLDELPQSQDPKLALRFITERTRTINITAVGGNATLLELGSDGH